MRPVIRWSADPELAVLIRRYYTGEAALWMTIRDRIDAELRARGIEHGAYHIRLRRSETGYEILIDDAPGYANNP